MKRMLALFAALVMSAGAAEYRAVFDCSSGDPRYILSRMNLIEKTAAMLESRGDEARFAVTIHGGCIVAAAQDFEVMVSEEEAVYIRKSQEILARLVKERKVDVVACGIALEGFGIDREDVVPFMRISENSYIDVIGYQNRGYALVPLIK